MWIINQSEECECRILFARHLQGKNNSYYINTIKGTLKKNLSNISSVRQKISFLGYFKDKRVNQSSQQKRPT
jgi:hypothetical protein